MRKVSSFSRLEKLAHSAKKQISDRWQVQFSELHQLHYSFLALLLRKQGVSPRPLTNVSKKQQWKFHPSSLMHPFKAHFRHFSVTRNIVAASCKISSPCVQLCPALSIHFPQGSLPYLSIDLLCSINMLECQLESPSCPSVRGEPQHISKSFSGWLCQQAAALVSEDKKG